MIVFLLLVFVASTLFPIKVSRGQEILTESFSHIDTSQNNLTSFDLEVDYKKEGNTYTVRNISGSFNVEGRGSAVCWARFRYSVVNSHGIEIYTNESEPQAITGFSILGNVNKQFYYNLIGRNVVSNDFVKITAWVVSSCGFEKEVGGLANALLNDGMSTLGISDQLLSEAFGGSFDAVSSLNISDQVFYIGNAGCNSRSSNYVVLFDDLNCTGGALTLENNYLTGDFSQLATNPNGDWLYEFIVAPLLDAFRKLKSPEQPNLFGGLKSAVRAIYVPQGSAVVLRDASSNYLCLEQSAGDLISAHYHPSNGMVYSNLENILVKPNRTCNGLLQELFGASSVASFVVPQSAILTIPFTQDVNALLSQTPDPAESSCSKFGSQAPTLAYLFGEGNCSGTTVWFSAHPENGPSANSSSLYVPTNSVVKVSSNDNGSGETACFSETQENLGSWTNKIQWAQLIPGGSCPVITADSYSVHTNQGDFRVNVGQTWDNTQHNRQILGFDRQGSAHLKINHVNGNQRCWDDTKSAQQLQNDGDWWIQTRSIEIGSGYCPGMSGQLQVFNLANYQGSQNDIRAGNSQTYPDNDLKYSFRFTEQGMSAKLTNADGRTRCWNTNVSNLQDHEDYWHRTTRIEVFGTDVCPPIPTVPSAGQFTAGTGVYYKYYEYTGGFPGLPMPDSWSPVRTGTIGNFDLNQAGHREDGFSLKFFSCLNVPVTGSYTFATTSDDGSELYINDQLVVDNDGAHPVQEKYGSINLTAGVHKIEVQFYEGGGDQALGVAWSSAGFAKAWIPNSALSQSGCDLSEIISPPLSEIDEGQFVAGSGVRFKYYEHEGNITTLPLSNILNPARVGVSSNFNLGDVNPRADNFALVYQTCYKVPASGTYTFYTSSDEGSKLFIDNQLVVANDGVHGVTQKSGQINLTAGIHNIEIQYFEIEGGQQLAAMWVGPGGGSPVVIPASRLSRTGCNALPPTAPDPNPSQFSAGSGVSYKYYEHTGNISTLPISSSWTPVRTGVVSNFNLSELSPRADNFAIVYQTCYSVPASGTYTFYTNSDDGSRLYVDNQLVVNNDGSHTATQRSGQIYLGTGVHNIEVQYFELSNAQKLSVLWLGPGGGSPQIIPAFRLSHTGCNSGWVQGSSLNEDTNLPKITTIYLPLVNK